MVWSRRNILKMIGVWTASAPLAAKAVAEEMSIGAASEIMNGKFGEGVFDRLGGAKEIHVEYPHISYRQIMGAIRLPVVREKVIDLIWEDEKQVTALDNDLASLKAISLAAKICIQRERNVKRRIRELERGQSRWNGATNAILEVLGSSILK